MTGQTPGPHHGGDAVASPAASSEQATGEQAPFTLAAVGSGLRVVAERLDAIEDHTVSTVTDLTALNQRVNGLQAVVEDLVKKDRTPIPPEPWAARATAEQWTELVDWVDWFNTVYEVIGEHIPPCWPAHPGVVEEVAGVWRAWVAAVVADTRAKHAGSVDLSAWHDRWLWAAIRRLRADHYAMSNCRPGSHESPIRSIRPTDRSLLPTPAAAAVEMTKPGDD